MYKGIVLVLLIPVFCLTSYSQELTVHEMDVSWKFDDDSVTFSASAPDNGWIALGFNTKNDIVGSNLVMVNVVDGIVNTEDFYVIGVGDPRPVSELGSKSQILNASGKESKGTTWVNFTLPTKAFDRYHLDLKKGKTIWLICAFSMEDEFDHHSRMRKHVEIQL